MKVIVPLAGPDYFVGESPKGLISTPNGPLLLATLKTRPWYPIVPSSDYSFVLLDQFASRSFYANHLSKWFPGCSVAFLGQPARGAAVTASIGAAAVLEDPEVPLIVDLADIQFSSSYVPFAGENDGSTAAVGFSFESSLGCYSYFSLAKDGLTVLGAEEKKVISRHASAGVYAFRSVIVMMRAMANVLENGDRYICNNVYYVCPLFNGVVEAGLKAVISPVSDVFDIKSH